MSVVPSLSVSSLLWVLASLLTFDPSVCILALQTSWCHFRISYVYRDFVCMSLFFFILCMNVWCVCVCDVFVCVCVTEQQGRASQVLLILQAEALQVGLHSHFLSLPLDRVCFRACLFIFRSVYVCLCVCTFYLYLPVVSLIYQIESSWACVCSKLSGPQTRVRY